MAYDEELADRIRWMLDGTAVTEKKMFGGLGFLVGGNLAVSASRRGGLMVRVDPATSESLLAEPGTELMEMGGRGPMPGWIHVGLDAVDDDAALRSWLDRGVSYATSLPAK